MLKSLSISNLAVVTRLQVDFGEGLNLLTGETGSGKSIIVDALGVLLGGRGSHDIIRSGQSKAYVEGIFRVTGHKELLEMVEEAGIETDGTELVIRRELSSTGRSRAFINDQLTTVGFLRELRPFLVDIHGQGEQQSLLYPDSHIDLLDLYAGHEKEREHLKLSYRKWQELERTLAELRRDEADRLRSLDILEFQSREIDRTNLEPGEDIKLADERKLLLNAERLVSVSTQCYDLLYESESAILTQLATISRRVEELAGLDARFYIYIEAVKNAKYSLEDLAYFLRDYTDIVDFSNDRLKQIDDRLAEIDRLKRKYGDSIETILAASAEMHERLERLQSFESREHELVAAISEASGRYLRLAQHLSQKRHAAARRLEKSVLDELQHLAMEQSEFVVGFLAEKESARATERGLDSVEFLVSPNVGEELRPLARIASGGEISRLMLALKTITSPTEYPRTLVFDEVDVGIGGRVAESVGQRLKRLASASQVLCVTHQAQIARFADIHHSVEKRIVSDRTEVVVEKLDQNGRIEELARMIGGAEITELTRRHAHELLFK
jgi:DNA repair protein RecN (Recombination protein N)